MPTEREGALGGLRRRRRLKQYRSEPHLTPETRITEPSLAGPIHVESATPTVAFSLSTDQLS
jgi:hypothetical protein